MVSVIDRPGYAAIWTELARDKGMVFMAGPRQAGKTTLANRIAGVRPNHVYFNWDVVSDRARLLRDPHFFEQVERVDASTPLVVFDEIHKYRDWKNYLKGVYDRFHRDYQFLVTGSGRLDLYRRGGDSLAGRYALFHLWPFTLAELTGRQETVRAFWSDPLAVVPDEARAAGEHLAPPGPGLGFPGAVHARRRPGVSPLVAGVPQPAHSRGHPRPDGHRLGGRGRDAVRPAARARGEPAVGDEPGRGPEGGLQHSALVARGAGALLPGVHARALVAERRSGNPEGEEAVPSRLRCHRRCGSTLREHGGGRTPSSRHGVERPRRRPVPPPLRPQQGKAGSGLPHHREAPTPAARRGKGHREGHRRRVQEDTSSSWACPRCSWSARARPSERSRTATRQFSSRRRRCGCRVCRSGS